MQSIEYDITEKYIYIFSFNPIYKNQKEDRSKLHTAATVFVYWLLPSSIILTWSLGLIKCGASNLQLVTSAHWARLILFSLQIVHVIGWWWWWYCFVFGAFNSCGCVYASLFCSVTITIFAFYLLNSTVYCSYLCSFSTCMSACSASDKNCIDYHPGKPWIFECVWYRWPFLSHHSVIQFIKINRFRFKYNPIIGVLTIRWWDSIAASNVNLFAQ